MSVLINIIIRLGIGISIFVIPSEKYYPITVEEWYQGNSPGAVSEAAEIKGYRDVISYNGKLVAVGTDGRIDYINNYSKITTVATNCRGNLNCIISEGQILVIGGENGTILFSPDGQIFTRVESGTDKNINGIAFINQLFVAGADKGTILVSKNGKNWSGTYLEVRGNIVSVTASDSICFGVTDSGEIIRSNDGLKWDISDYNKEYSGYNKPCIFARALLAQNRIVLIGTHDDGSPVVLFSSLGNVWTERSLFYNDNNGIIRFLTNKPNDITYDRVRDQFILACDNGELFSLPSCTKCNESVTISTNNIYGIILTENLLLSVGEGFFINILKF
jgi:hypothetical protein